MIRKMLATIAAVTVLSGTFYAVSASPASADTESCVSHGEYDQTDVFMTPAHIASIYDVWGTYQDTANPDTFARIYHSLCWTDSQEIRIVYDQDSSLSISWRLQDK